MSNYRVVKTLRPMVKSVILTAVIPLALCSLLVSCMDGSNEAPPYPPSGELSPHRETSPDVPLINSNNEREAQEIDRDMHTGDQAAGAMAGIEAGFLVSSSSATKT